MSDSRWVDEPVMPYRDMKGRRYRVTFDAQAQPERLEVETPHLPAEPGWYRLPETFGAVFHRDDDTWLDANGSRIDTAAIPDGLIPLIDGPITEDAS